MPEPNTPTDSTKLTPDCVFFDRDGTLIQHIHYLRDPDQVILSRGTQKTMRFLKDRCVPMFLFTNQSGVSRGLMTLQDVTAVNNRILDLIGLGRDLFSGICVATELPNGRQRYRKPSPRFIHEKLREINAATTNSWIIGDSPADWLAGLYAGIRAAAVGNKLNELSQRRRQWETLGVEFHLDLAEWLERLIYTNN